MLGFMDYGFTQSRIIKDFKWYSVDSCTWGSASSRGRQLHKFNGEYIESKKIETDYKIKLAELAKHNMIEWVKYQRYLDKMNVR